jgi:hypothetical protein
MKNMENFFAQLERFFITTPLLGSISQGKFFTKAFAWLLRICAALAVIWFIYFSITLWITFARGTRSFMGDMGDALGGRHSVGVFFAVLFAQLLAIPLFYVIINIFLVRSNAISKLPLQTDYVVIPVAVQLIKMTGEILAAFVTVLGVFTTLAFLVSRSGGVVHLLLGRAVSAPGMGSGFAYTAFITGPVAGFLLLVFFYSIAELIGALVDIARNTKKK